MRFKLILAVYLESEDFFRSTYIRFSYYERLMIKGDKKGFEEKEIGPSSWQYGTPADDVTLNRI